MNSQQYEQLNTLLEQGILFLEKLSTIYDSEQAALASKDLEQLSDIIQEKTDLLNKFHQFTQERSNLLASFGIQQDPADYSLPESESDLTAATAQLHSRIKELLIDLQSKNKRNEQIVYRSEQNVTQLLSLVRGQKKQDKLYDKAGGSSLYKAQSRLGKA